MLNWKKELISFRDQANSRSAALQTVNGVNRKFNDARSGRKGRISSRANEITGVALDDSESWCLKADDLKMELQARKQREAVLEAALADKEFVEEEFRRKAEEAKKREQALENDLANMWVLVAKLKKEGAAVRESNLDQKNGDEAEHINDPKPDNIEGNAIPKEQDLDEPKPDEVPKEERLVVRLKVINNVLLLFIFT